jgi:hypothetical protein
MKFSGTEHLQLFATFVDRENHKYIRIVPLGTPIWYVGYEEGFKLVLMQDKYNQLEKTYNEQKQQESKKQGDSPEIYPFTPKGPEGTKPN